MTSLERPAAAVLAVDDDPMILTLLEHGLGAAGYRVTTARSGQEALDRLAEAIPDVIVSDVNMPDLDGFSLVQHLRRDPDLRGIPLVFLTSRSDPADVVSGLHLGADDYLTKPFELPVLVARVASKLHRPPVPADKISTDRRTGLAGPHAVRAALGRERDRSLRSGREGQVAVLDLLELPSVRLRLGPRSVDEVVRQVGDRLRDVIGPLDVAGRTDDGRFALVLPETPSGEVAGRLQLLSETLAAARLTVAGEQLSVTPLVGYAQLAEGKDAAEALAFAGRALDQARSDMDLRPVQFRPSMARSAARHMRRTWRDRLRTPSQIALTVLIGLVLPFLLYVAADRAGFDIVPAVYLVVVVALLLTGVSIWIEGLHSLNPYQPPPAPQEQSEDPPPYPAASAIVAAYLPNEAATVVETVEAFLRVDYPGPFQVLLAYNSPVPLPVEGVLARIAVRDPRLQLVKVAGSSSKAQNVNAALSEVTGEFVGVFDADHHPDPDSFRRAWRWLADGFDVVQGHAVVRNGEASWVARMVAVEFEMIYGVSHPGRAKLHGFGIFGGSNGYWRTELLRRTRMRGSMLTEDIDSSLRVVEAGYRIGSDPQLISRELAPTTLQALWNQRMRWAQGWFQVSIGHLFAGVVSRHLNLRQKLGFAFLLGWRELYPWLSVQMFPVLAFYSYKLGSARRVDYLIPIFVLTTLFTVSVGPWQTLFAYRQAGPELRARKRWFWSYLLISSTWYTEYKNTVARVAQVKQFMREKTWKVTPRAAGTGGAPAGAVATQAEGSSANDPMHPPTGEQLAPPPVAPASGGEAR